MRTVKATGLVVLALFLGIAATPATAQERGIELSGEWLAEGRPDRPCAIFRHGVVLLVVNENGDLATARFTGRGGFVILKGDGWEAGATARIDPRGRALRWSNGSVWSRR